MPDDADIPGSASLTSPAKKPRGRPPRPAPTETHQQRIERLQAELQQAQEAQKLAEQHQASIVGPVVLRHARANPDFRRQLAALLKADIKSKADLAAISDLLI